MLRKIVVIAVILIVVATAFASAANLGVSGGTIQAGVDSTLYCDLDGVWVDGWGLETDDNSVHFVRIGGIDGACIANDMFIKIEDGAGAKLAAGKITITGATATLNFVPPLDANDIEHVLVWIEGAN